MPTNYAMGWTPSLPDFRDRKYSAPLGATYPPMNDLMVGFGKPLLPTASQGDLGACGAFTLGKHVLWTEMKDGDVPKVPSYLFIYWIARYLMGTVNSDSGVQNRLLMKAAKMFGWADEDKYPYDISIFTQKPPQDVFDQAATRKPDFGYVAISQDLNSLKGCLMARPFILGFSCYSSMFTPHVEQTGIVPMPSMRDSLAGGHDVLCVGFQNTGGDLPGVEPGKVWPNNTLKCLNHWYKADGTPHGDGGFIYLPYAYVANPSLAGDFWAVTNDGIINPLHPPVPPVPEPLPPTPPAPTPSPSFLKTLIDKIFTDLEASELNPLVKVFIQTIHALFDQYMSTNNMAAMIQPADAHGIRQIVDTIFAAIEAQQAGRPIVLISLKYVQMLVDRWIDANF